MALNVFMLHINLYINYVVMPVEVANNACSVCFISHAQGSLFAQVSGLIHLDARGSWDGGHA